MLSDGFDAHFLTDEDAASRLGVAASSVHKLVKMGQIVDVQAPDGRRRIPVPEVERFAERRRHGDVPAEVLAAIDTIASADLDRLVSEFKRDTGHHPVAYLAAWHAGDIDETPENERVALQARRLRDALRHAH